MRIGGQCYGTHAKNSLVESESIKNRIDVYGVGTAMLKCL
jgi:hypothetical protein